MPNLCTDPIDWIYVLIDWLAQKLPRAFHIAQFQDTFRNIFFVKAGIKNIALCVCVCDYMYNLVIYPLRFYSIYSLRCSRESFHIFHDLSEALIMYIFS